MVAAAFFDAEDFQFFRGFQLVVQYSLPRSFGEELPHQSGDIEEIAHSSSSIFPKENEERCLDSAPQKD